jgi:hypothetical protein
VAPDLPEPYEPQLRIGTPEREAVIAQLNTALIDGRLDLGEYDERVRQVYVAKTVGELAPLTADLPAPVAPGPPKPNILARLDPAERGWLAMATLLLTIWLIGLVAGAGPNGFWPIWPIGITGAALLARRITR